MATLKIRLSLASQEYASHLSARGLAAGTIRSRAGMLRLLEACVGDVYVENLTADHVDRLFAAHAWAAKTRNVKLSMLRTFFRWCQQRRYMDRHADLLAGYRNLPCPVEPRTRIPVDEWPRLFEACMHPTETAALATGLFLFLRGSEQQAIQLKHVHLDEGTIDVYRAKTRQWDTMPISSELDAYLRDYLTWYADTVGIHPDYYLHAPRIIASQERCEATNRILPGTGTIDPTRAIAKPHQTIQRILRRAGYPTAKEGEHTLRRSGARAWFDQLAESGYDGALRRVQSMLGHSTSLVTESYLGIDLDRRQRDSAVRGQRMFPNLTTAALPSEEGNVIALRG